MSRPRQNSNQLSATERMRNAFWSLLAQTDYDKITVTTIVEKAQVNRNSFYYHYDKLDDLAQSVIVGAVNSIAEALPDLVDDPTESWRRIVMQILGVPANRVHVDHLTLTVGEHSSPLLFSFTHDAIRGAFVEAQHLDPHNMSLTSDVLLEFTTGGLMSLIAMWPGLSKRITLDQLVTIDGAVLARTLYLSISNSSMPGFWTRLFRTTMQQQEHSPVAALTQIEEEDKSFKEQVEALLAKANAAQGPDIISALQSNSMHHGEATTGSDTNAKGEGSVPFDETSTFGDKDKHPAR